MDAKAIIQIINNAAIDHASTSHEEKAQLIAACSNLLSSLTSVEMKLMDLLFSPFRAIALRLAIDMHLFDVSGEALKRGESIELQQLSEKTNCDPLLIKRVMRILIDIGVFKELGKDQFQPQPSCAMYKTESPVAQAIIHFTTQMLPVINLPDYFAEKGYRSPNDAYDSPFQYARGTKLHMFDWIAERPEKQHAFNVTMTMRADKFVGKTWFDTFPIEELTRECKSETLMVDIGGGVGHHLISLKQRYPDLEGRLIVQDIPAVIDTVRDLPGGVEAQSYDFFEPQPVQQARCYLLAHILHDWPDKQAKIILEQIRNAMGPGSILLVDETIMPEIGVAFMPAVMDIAMMAAFASLERTEQQFRDLFDQVGLNLVKVWRSENTTGQMIMEVRLKN